MEIISRQKRVVLNCVKCGVEFWTHAFRAETAKYCSKSCWSDRAPVRDCETCGSSFKVSIGDREKYCSKSCYTTTMKGEGHPGWKGGASLESERGRASSELKAWRQAVFERDGFTCQGCGTAGGDMHAHHRLHFATHPEARFDISNGVTLCVACHGAVHGKDFTNRRKRECVECGEPTSGRSKHGTCRSCGVMRALRDGKMRPRQKSAQSPQEQPSSP